MTTVDTPTVEQYLTRVRELWESGALSWPEAYWDALRQLRPDLVDETIVRGVHPLAQFTDPYDFLNVVLIGWGQK